MHKTSIERNRTRLAAPDTTKDSVASKDHDKRYDASNVESLSTPQHLTHDVHVERYDKRPDPNNRSKEDKVASVTTKRGDDSVSSWRCESVVKERDHETIEDIINFVEEGCASPESEGSQWHVLSNIMKLLEDDDDLLDSDEDKIDKDEVETDKKDAKLSILDLESVEGDRKIIQRPTSYIVQQDDNILGKEDRPIDCDNGSGQAAIPNEGLLKEIKVEKIDNLEMESVADDRAVILSPTIRIIKEEIEIPDSEDLCNDSGSGNEAMSNIGLLNEVKVENMSNIELKSMPDDLTVIRNDDSSGQKGIPNKRLLNDVKAVKPITGSVQKVQENENMDTLKYSTTIADEETTTRKANEIDALVKFLNLNVDTANLCKSRLVNTKPALPESADVLLKKISHISPSSKNKGKVKPKKDLVQYSVSDAETDRLYPVHVNLIDMSSDDELHPPGLSPKRSDRSNPARVSSQPSSSFVFGSQETFPSFGISAPSTDISPSRNICRSNLKIVPLVDFSTKPLEQPYEGESLIAIPFLDSPKPIEQPYQGETLITIPLLDIPSNPFEQHSQGQSLITIPFLDTPTKPLEQSYHEEPLSKATTTKYKPKHSPTRSQRSAGTNSSYRSQSPEKEKHLISDTRSRSLDRNSRSGSRSPRMNSGRRSSSSESSPSRRKRPRRGKDSRSPEQRRRRKSTSSERKHSRKSVSPERRKRGRKPRSLDRKRVRASNSDSESRHSRSSEPSGSRRISGSSRLPSPDSSDAKFKSSTSSKYKTPGTRATQRSQSPAQKCVRLSSPDSSVAVANSSSSQLFSQQSDQNPHKLLQLLSSMQPLLVDNFTRLKKKKREVTMRLRALLTELREVRMRHDEISELGESAGYPSASEVSSLRDELEVRFEELKEISQNLSIQLANQERLRTLLVKNKLPTSEDAKQEEEEVLEIEPDRSEEIQEEELINEEAEVEIDGSEEEGLEETERKSSQVQKETMKEDKRKEKFEQLLKEEERLCRLSLDEEFSKQSISKKDLRLKTSGSLGKRNTIVEETVHVETKVLKKLVQPFKIGRIDSHQETIITSDEKSTKVKNTLEKCYGNNNNKFSRLKHKSTKTSEKRSEDENSATEEDIYDILKKKCTKRFKKTSKESVGGDYESSRKSTGGLGDSSEEESGTVLDQRLALEVTPNSKETSGSNDKLVADKRTGNTVDEISKTEDENIKTSKGKNQHEMEKTEETSHQSAQDFVTIESENLIKTYYSKWETDDIDEDQGCIEKLSSLTKKTDTDVVVAGWSEEDMDRLKAEIEADPFWGPMYRIKKEEDTLRDRIIVRQNNINPDYFKLFKDVLWKSFVVFGEDGTKGETFWRIVVPRSWSSKVLPFYHSDEAGHCDVSTMIDAVRQDFVWIGFSEDINNFVENCSRCQDSPAEEITDNPFNDVIIDYVGPLPKTRSGYEYIVGIIDTFSMFVRLYPIRRLTEETVTDTFEDFSLMYEYPRLSVTYDQSLYGSETFQNFCKLHNISHINLKKPANLVNANIKVNRVVKQKVSSKRLKGLKKWGLFLRKVERFMNHSVNKETGYIPVSIVMRAELKEDNEEEWMQTVGGINIKEFGDVVHDWMNCLIDVSKSHLERWRTSNNCKPVVNYSPRAVRSRSTTRR